MNTHKIDFLTNKNIKISSFKSSENIKKERGWARQICFE